MSTMYPSERDEQQWAMDDMHAAAQKRIAELDAECARLAAALAEQEQEKAEAPQRQPYSDDLTAFVIGAFNEGWAAMESGEFASLEQAYNESHVKLQLELGDPHACDCRAAVDRLSRQSRDIGMWLREAGCPAMPIPEGVKWLLHRAEHAEASLAAQAQEIEEDRRTLKSIATMLGWMNVPPRDTFEAHLRALRERDRQQTTQIETFTKERDALKARERREAD